MLNAHGRFLGRIYIDRTRVEDSNNLLEDSSFFQVSQELDDMLGHGWRSGQMVSSGLESVLIGDPVDSDDNAIWGCVRVTSLGNGSGVFSCLADLFLRSTLLDFDTVFSFESVDQRNYDEILYEGYGSRQETAYAKL